MGSVVSSADNNDDFVTNLCKTKHIISPEIEQVFRMVDRINFMAFEGDEKEVEEARQEAYEDRAWKSGTYHLSAPCIYTKAMEALKIEPKLSFLNIGSGTGYLSTMVGMLLGPRGINRGVEIHAANAKFAKDCVNRFIRDSPFYDPTQFCPPDFQVGNGLLLDPQHGTYDRVYCGADVPDGYDGVMKCMLNTSGVLVMPYNGALLTVTRLSQTEWKEEIVLSSVSFAPLILPTEECMKDTQAIDFGYNIPSLQRMCRLAILELVHVENRTQFSLLPLPSHLVSFLTYDGTLRAEHPKERPESLIATGNLPEDEPSGGSDSEKSSPSRNIQSRLLSRIMRGRGEPNKGDDAPFFLYGRNGVSYVFSMGEDASQDIDDSQRSTDVDRTDISEGADIPDITDDMTDITDDMTDMTDVTEMTDIIDSHDTSPEEIDELSPDATSK